MSWTLFDGISAGLMVAELGLLEGAEEAFENGADQVLTWAKSNAPWEDRTGMARESLFTEVYQEGAEVILTLGHGVDYGQWLELIQNGRFAIIMPTLEQFAQQIFEDAGGRMTDVDTESDF